MNSRSSRPYLLWLALLSAFIAVVVLVMLAFTVQQRNATRSSFTSQPDSMANLVFQFDREYLRLSRAVSNYLYEPTPAQADALGLRADIFHSRLVILQDSPSASAVTDSPEIQALILKLVAIDSQLSAQSAGQAPDRAALRALLPTIQALESEVQNLSFIATSKIAADVETQAQVILRQNRLISGLTVCQLLLLLASAYFLYTRHHIENRERDVLLRANRKLQENEARLALAASVFNHSRESIIVLDRFGLIVEANRNFCRTAGLSPQALKGCPLNQFVTGAIDEIVLFQAILDAVQNTGYWAGEMNCRRTNGVLYPVQINVSPVLTQQQQVEHYVIFLTDISEIKQKQSELEYVAHFDVLTGLPNRVLLLDRLQKALANAVRHGRSLAVAFIDLDGFKEVNDTHGHAIGDQLLVVISRNMEKALRETDSIARFGGDEFVVLITDLEKTSDCVPVLERLLEATASLLPVNHLLLKISASIGVTIFPQDNLGPDQLVRHADQAMYQAKQSGKNQYYFFDATHAERNADPEISLTDIKLALEPSQFVLYYQPKVNMHTGSVEGVEALIRWNHPTRGLLSPAAFLPLIEDKPISIELSKWVIASAIEQMECWERDGLILNVSINVSALHLQHPLFFSHVEKYAATLKRLHGQLSIEILETTALSDIARVREKLLQCQSIGIQFSLDDFGTGYSSLSYLSDLPAQELKIDQSFVRKMATDPSNLSIVEGVISLARAFDKTVIAEGVETQEQGDILLRLGCDLAQGFAIARPMPAADLPGWIQHWETPPSWRVQTYVPRDPAPLLDRLIQGAPVGIAIINEDGFYENVNAAYYELYGYTRAEMIGHHFEMLFPGADRKQIVEGHQRFVKNGGDLSGLWTVTRKDGSPCEIISFSVRVPGENGQLYRLVYVTPTAVHDGSGRHD